MADLLKLAKENKVTEFEKEWANQNSKPYPLNTNDGITTTVDQKTFDNLCIMEAMNLYEQSSLSKYPGLHQWFLDNKQKAEE